MAAEHVSVRPPTAGRSAPSTDWPDGADDPAAPGAPALVRTPPNDLVVEAVEALPPGKALDLGCGDGADSVWLAERGWVVNAVDASAAAISTARAQAADASVDDTIVFRTADPARWAPASRYDLVLCAMSIPDRGRGRSRVLKTAASAVALGGTIVLSDLDVSLARGGWMGDGHLVSTAELERYVDGFRIVRSAVRLARTRFGYEDRVLPVALVVATRREDLRSPY